jgi:DNA-binding beta-propeller fold protein YncE
MAVSLFAALACQCPGPASQGQNADDDAGNDSPGGFVATFSTTSDFMRGVADGVSYDVPDQVQMQIALTTFKTPYLWVPNSDDVPPTISKIDVATAKELGRYPLVDADGKTCYWPSRTTVDSNFDVWVGCRGSASYSYTYCPADPNCGIEDRIDHKVMKVSFETGKVLLTINVGHAPRGFGIDAKGNVWLVNSADNTLWELDGQTGTCLRGDSSMNPTCAAPAIAVPPFPYGAMVDADGDLWVVSNDIAKTSMIYRVNTTTAEVSSFGPFVRDGCQAAYSLAVDLAKHVWVSGFSCGDLFELDGHTGHLINDVQLGGETRGVAVDTNGDVWVASSGINAISKVNGFTVKKVTSQTVGMEPIGVGIDATGHAWVVHRGSNDVYRMQSLEPYAIDARIPVGQGPYTYSDMLGLSLNLITRGKSSNATWTIIVDSQKTDAQFTDVSWSADVPTGTTFGVHYCCNNDSTALTGMTWSSLLAQPGAIQCSGRYLQVQAVFTGSGSLSPALHSLSASWN